MAFIDGAGAAGTVVTGGVIIGFGVTAASGEVSSVLQLKRNMEIIMVTTCLKCVFII